MTALDSGQRYLRLDEQDGQGTINARCYIYRYLISVMNTLPREF